jgi:predicted nucleic acid-binding protein
MISFDTNVLIYATAAGADEKASRARELLARAIRAANSILLLQSLAEFSNVAIRKAGIAVDTLQRIVQAWCAVLPIQAADEGDLFSALDVVSSHHLAFWDAMSAQRAGTADGRISRRFQFTGHHIYQSVQP